MGAAASMMEGQTRYFCHACHNHFAGPGEETEQESGQQRLPRCPICQSEAVEQVVQAQNGTVMSLQQAARLNSAAALLQAIEQQLRDEITMLSQMADNAAGGEGNRGQNKLHPTPERILSKMVTAPISEIVRENQSSCIVCTDDFDHGEHIMPLPCAHVFHKDCIVPWLSKTSTCPVCRFDLTAVPELGSLEKLPKHELLEQLKDANVEHDSEDSNAVLAQLLHEQLTRLREQDLEQERQAEREQAGNSLAGNMLLASLGGGLMAVTTGTMRGSGGSGDNAPAAAHRQRRGNAGAAAPSPLVVRSELSSGGGTRITLIQRPRISTDNSSDGDDSSSNESSERDNSRGSSDDDDEDDDNDGDHYRRRRQRARRGYHDHTRANSRDPDLATPTGYAVAQSLAASSSTTSAASSTQPSSVHAPASPGGRPRLIAHPSVGPFGSHLQVDPATLGSPSSATRRAGPSGAQTHVVRTYSGDSGTSSRTETIPPDVLRRMHSRGSQGSEGGGAVSGRSTGSNSPNDPRSPGGGSSPARSRLALAALADAEAAQAQERVQARARARARARVMARERERRQLLGLDGPSADSTEASRAAAEYNSSENERKLSAEEFDANLEWEQHASHQAADSERDDLQRSPIVSRPSFSRMSSTSSSRSSGGMSARDRDR